MNKNLLIFFFNESIFILTILILLKNYYHKSEFNFGFKSDEFRVILKDVNISFFYYGFGEHSCRDSSNLLIATLSRPMAFGARMAVRSSWKKDIPSTFTHKFFIGSVHDEGIRQALKKESQKFGDIVFTSLIDSYTNLTLKMNALYQWQQIYCPKVDYFMRADEDTVLDVSRFQYWLNNEFNIVSKNLNKMVIFGFLFHNNIVLRNPNGRWYIPYEAYNSSYYPDYVQGPCYLATSKAIKLILEEAKNHPHITVDDAFYTGIVRDAAGVQVFDGSKYFALGNPIMTINPLTQWDHKCDRNGVPFLFSIVDEIGEIETVPGGYFKALQKLKELNSSCLTTSESD